MLNQNPVVDVNQNKLFQRMDQHEYQLCLLFNKYTTIKMVRAFFAVISRLGNGVFWYGLILSLPFIYGLQALTTSIMMTLSGTVGVIIYKLLKTNLVRQRPCIHHTAIQQGTAMLDLYSFPSGHTLHAFSFGIIALHAFPQLAMIVVPFMLLVTASRVVLGLHYPSDVVVGALIGSSLASIAISATV